MKIKYSRSICWTAAAFLLAFLVVIFNMIKLIRVFSLKILRGIPKEWTFELNLILSTSFFLHLIGFVYALGLPEKNKRQEIDQNFSLITGIFIIFVLIFHIVSTFLLIDYSPPNYLLI